MEKRRAGGSGLALSRLGLGTMTWGRDTDEIEAADQCRAFLDAGGNFLDTAATYGDGDSERVIGGLIGTLFNRDDVIIATKAGIKERTMLDVQAMKSLTQQITQVMPWLQGIGSDQQYDELLALMDELVEDYDANQLLIDLLFPVLQDYEETAERFKAFNQRIETLDPGIAMLRLLIDQHGLTQSDFQQEIGGKSLVSQILSGKRSLTLGHIRALSKRFGIPAAMFV